MASGDAVQQIKERLSIVDVVAPYVELHPAGKNMKGRCPFHSEKTPSFNISPDRGTYYCFGCSKGGDVFTFIEEMEGVDFKEALKQLADKAGVELVAEDPKKRTEREEGYSILDTAATFFATKLGDTEAARMYLKDRGVTGETIARWRLGYAPGPPLGGWRDLRAHLTEQKFTDTQQVKAGLIKSADQGKEPYDVFRDRVMFPIFDSSGKVVAFSGRILAKDTEAPKYVNSPETDFFNKSEILYGFDKAKGGIRKFDFSLIVEGQFDVVLCHQAGYNNTVAVSGTALTAHHVGLLQRLSNRVVLALDSDKAGIAAVKRAADLMLVRGIDVKVAQIPDGQDPADIIKDDPAAFKGMIGNATHVINFLLAILKKDAKDERNYKLRVRDEVLPYIVKIDNKIDADHFEGVVAEAIDTTKAAVHLEVVRLQEEEANKPKSVAAVLEKRDPAQPAVQYDRQGDLQSYLVIAASLVSADKKTIIQEIIERVSGTALVSLEDALTAEEKSKLTFMLESEFAGLAPLQLDDELHSKLREYQLLTVRHRLSVEKAILQAAEQHNDEEIVASQMQKISTLQKELGIASVITNVFSKEENDVSEKD